MPTDPPDADSTLSSSPHLFTVVRDDLPFATKFTSKNLNVGNFLKETESEISRQGVTTDKDKIAIVRSRVDLGDCHAGNALQAGILKR